MDLKAMSDRDLKTLARRVGREQERRKRKERTATLRKLRSIAKDAGYSLEELVGAKPAPKPIKRRAKAKVKFRNPQDATQTWSGRGRRPRWLEAEIKAGKKIESFAVK